MRELAVAKPSPAKKAKSRLRSDALTIAPMSSAVAISRGRDKRKNNVRTAAPDKTHSTGAVPKVFVTRRPPNHRAPGVSPSCHQINLQGNATSTLSAQITGTWANLLVYQDPACSVSMEIGGNGTFLGTGSIYIPSAQFVFDGNPSTLNGSQLIARTVNVQNGNITINYNPTTTAQPILPRLAE